MEWKSKDSDGHFAEVNEWKVNSWWVEMNESDIKCSVSEINNILYSEFSKPFNPFNDYFASLKPWDGTDYIGLLAERVKTTDQALWQHCFKIWLVAFVACAIMRDKVNHLALILRSDKQGIGKTTWFKKLLPPELENYFYSGIPKFDDRDTLISLFQNLLISIDEIDAMSKRDSNLFHEFITKPSIQARRAYGRNIETYERHASFCGSTNSKHILTDLSGSRRFLCFDVEEIDYTSPIEYENVYSHAMALLENGFRHWLDMDDIEEINRINEKYRQCSPEEEFFHLYFRKPLPGDSPQAGVYMASSEIMRKINGRTGIYITKGACISIGKIMRREGFEEKKVHGVSKYFVVERSDRELDDEKRRGGDNPETQTNIPFKD